MRSESLTELSGSASTWTFGHNSAVERSSEWIYLKRALCVSRSDSRSLISAPATSLRCICGPTASEFADTFDVVTAIDVLYHILDDQTAERCGS